jgi:hypothetical protein
MIRKLSAAQNGEGIAKIVIVSMAVVLLTKQRFTVVATTGLVT